MLVNETSSMASTVIGDTGSSADGSGDTPMYNMTELLELLQGLNHSGALMAIREAITSQEAGEADDAIWILTSTFIIFTMQSGQYLHDLRPPS